MGKGETHCAKAGRQVVYPALVLYHMLSSASVPTRDKLIVIGALGYLILPMDFVPDFIPILGFADDASALALALKFEYDNVTPEMESRAKVKAKKKFANGINKDR